MFVPLLLAGGCIGNAFGQSVVHTNAVDLYAAVGMAAFISGGYKTPLTAVVFVAETTGGHSYLIPSLIGAAVAYAVSGEASVSADQHLHEMVKIAELSGATVRDVMQTQVMSVSSRHHGKRFSRRHRRAPSPHDLSGLRCTTKSSAPSKPRCCRKPIPQQWDAVEGRRSGAARHHPRGRPIANSARRLRLLVREGGDQMLLVIDDNDRLSVS